MLKIGITGSIGSGKSEVIKILEKMQICVLDCDKINTQLLKKHAAGYNALKAHLDYDIFDLNNDIDRKKLSDLFNDFELKAKVEKLIHPLIIEKLFTEFDKYHDEQIIGVEVPLLFEAAMEDYFDECWVVISDMNLRLERLLKNRNISNEVAKRIIKHQMSQEEKIARSDVIIDNNGTLEQLKEQICDILKERI